MKLAISNASRNWRGTESICDVLARGLQGRGHDVVVFCRPDSPLHRRLAPDVECEPVLGGMDGSPATLWRAARALRRRGTEVLITQKDKDIRLTGIAAKLLGVPVIARQETDRPFKPGLRYRICYGWASAHHVANSAATERTVLGSASWLRPSDVTVIVNGIDAARFLTASPADLPLPAGALVVGYVGQLEPRKGVGDLARAWPAVAAAVPAAHLVLAGSGRLEGELRRLLDGAPRVHWFGFRDDVPALMKALDLLVAPSHFEGFGLTVVEAMAAGTAVVAAAASSIPEILTDGVEGHLAPSGEPAALAAAVIRLLGDAAARARMGRAGQARAGTEFTIERMLDAHEALLTRVAAGYRGRGGAVRA